MTSKPPLPPKKGGTLRSGSSQAPEANTTRTVYSKVSNSCYY